MSLATIEIEQVNANEWRAEVEVGGLVARRANPQTNPALRAPTLKALLIAIEAAYEAMLPKQPEAADERPAVTPAASEPERKVTTLIDDRPVDVTPVPHRAVSPPPAEDRRVPRQDHQNERPRHQQNHPQRHR